MWQVCIPRDRGRGPESGGVVHANSSCPSNGIAGVGLEDRPSGELRLGADLSGRDEPRARLF